MKAASPCFASGRQATFYSAVPLLGLLAVSAAGTGCATKMLPPPDAGLRAKLGSVCIVADTNVSRIRFQVPDSKADIAAEQLPYEQVKEDSQRVFLRAFGSTDDPRPPYLGLAETIIIYGGAPVWQEMRRGVGLVIADSADRVSAARTTMDAAAAGVRFEQELRDRLAAELATSSPTTRQIAWPQRADTLLELNVYEPAITGREGINPGLSLQLGLRVRLLNVRTRAELYYDYLDYRSPSHTLVEWAADDAMIFRAELERCLAHLSSEVIAQLFIRPETDTASRSALAAHGLSRRPPQPLIASAANTPPLPPAYRPPVYAYHYRR